MTLDWLEKYTRIRRGIEINHDAFVIFLGNLVIEKWLLEFEMYSLEEKKIERKSIEDRGYNACQKSCNTNYIFVISFTFVFFISFQAMLDFKKYTIQTFLQFVS